MEIICWEYVIIFCRYDAISERSEVKGSADGKIVSPREKSHIDFWDQEKVCMLCL